VTARPYVTPGLVAGYGAMTIELRGEVVEGDGGSVVRGDVSAPIRWTTPAWLGFAWILWVAFAIVSNGSTLWSWVFVVVGSLVIAAAWIWTIRHNQRMALRNVDELTRMLSSILSDAPSRAG
jgi:O-antigen/teichoic acid export membrane protein